MKYLESYKIFESKEYYTKEQLLEINDILLDLEDILEHRIIVSAAFFDKVGSKDHLFVDWDGTISEEYDYCVDMTIEITHKGEKFTGTVFEGDTVDRLVDVIKRIKEYIPESRLVYSVSWATGDREYVTSSDSYHKYGYTSDTDKLEEYFYPQNSVDQIDIEVIKK